MALSAFRAGCLERDLAEFESWVGRSGKEIQVWVFSSLLGEGAEKTGGGWRQEVFTPIGFSHNLDAGNLL